MNLLNILIWLTLVLISMALVVNSYLRNKRREKKTSSVLFNFAKENNSNLSNYDQWNNTLIGIDNNEVYKLFFVRTAPNREYKVVIKLSEVKSCRIVMVERTTKYKEDNIRVIDKIGLVFSFIDTKKQDEELEFYNTDYDQLTLSGELQLAQKWLANIKSILVANQNSKKEDNKDIMQASSVIMEPIGNTRMAGNTSKRKVKYATHTI